MNSGFYTTAGDDHLSGWTKKKLQSTFQSQTCTTKRSWSLFGHPLPVRSTADSETIISEKYTQQINEIHRKRQQLQLALVNRKGPILLHNNAQPHVTQLLQKLNKLSYLVLPHLPYSPDLSPTATSLSILTTFCRENASTTIRQKLLSKDSLNPEAKMY